MSTVKTLIFIAFPTLIVAEKVHRCGNMHYFFQLIDCVFKMSKQFSFQHYRAMTKQYQSEYQSECCRNAHFSYVESDWQFTDLVMAD